MAKAVTLKDQTNTEIYPVTDMSLVNGTAATAKIADGAVTAAKIDPSVLYYNKGDTFMETSDWVYVAGRCVNNSSGKYILCNIPLPKLIAPDVTTITFAASGWNEAFGASAVIFSVNNPTSSHLTFDASIPTTRSFIQLRINVITSATVTNSTCCVAKPSGTFTFS